MTEPSQNPEAQSRGLRNDQLSGAVLALLALFVAWQNRAYPVGTLAEPGPGFLPLALAVFLGAVGLLIAVRGGDSARLRFAAWPELGRAFVILAACAVAAVALERLGYRLTVIALLVFFLGVVERRHWLAALAVAAGFSSVSYLVFATWLKVPLPLSPWGF
ncbi:MAG TPA: tripartite tricarboxylate transporter TctB family protein [Burkholderiales bacterium]|nr:tripartite tricarboxylate transporter TctB family protein [Burkholderiales bacterium]